MSKKELSGKDYLTMYTNYFLASDAAKELIQNTFSEDSVVRKNLERQIQVHNDIIANRKNMAPGSTDAVQVALNSSQPLQPGPSNYVPPSPKPISQPNSQLPGSPLLTGRFDLS